VPIIENAAFFFDGPVQDYRGPADWLGPEYSYRLTVNGMSGVGKVIDQLNALVQHEDASRVRALIVGKWCDYGECSNAAIVESLVKHRDRLTGLVAVFLGDITRSEMQMSQIQNCDLTPLLLAYPKLEVLRVRGGKGLRFSAMQPHYSLRALIVETSGMPKSVLSDVCSCPLPNLVHLELWLGATSAGWDGSLAEFEALFDGAIFPSLKYLGLRNSEVVDEIAWTIANKPLLQRLETLDLSYGNMSDHGGRALWGITWDLPLSQLILNHHYLSPKIVRTLQMELKCKVIAEDGKNSDGIRRSIFAGE
jgi:hypothetical protein